MFLLDLVNLIWFEVKIFDGIVKERYEHCAVICDDRLIVFGGMDDHMYIAADVYTITIGKRMEFLFIKHI